MTMLIPIGIIGFGHASRTGHRKHIDDLCRTLGSHRVVRMDLRDLLTDPYSMLKMNGVQGDGTHEQTQKAVISQPEFVEAIDHSFHHLIDKLLECGQRHQGDPSSRLIGVVIAAGCNSGQHRAEVFRRCLSELLNSVKFDGLRVFNCCDFSMLGCKTEDNFVNRVEMPERWIKEPWKVVKAVVQEDSWCEANISRDWAAYDNFKKIWSFAESFQENYGEGLRSVLEIYDPDRFKDEHHEPRGVWRRHEPQPPRYPPSAKTVPKAQVKQHPGHILGSSSRARLTPIGQATFGRSGKSVEQDELVATDEQAEEEEHIWKKRRVGLDIDKWRVLEWDPKAWTSVLVERGMDSHVQKHFFLLAQYGEIGKWRANQLVSKMIDPGFHKDNPSGWLNICIKRAREDIDKGRR